jgi:putative ABC transport system permease protein
VDVGPMVYLAYLQSPSTGTVFVVRTRLGPLEVERTLKSVVGAVDPTQPVDRIAPMPQLLEDSLGEQRFKTYLLGVLSVLALIVACVGIYSVTAHVVTGQRHEVAVRMALGARPQMVMRLLAVETGRWIIVGAIAGLIVAVALARLAAEVLPEVQRLTPATYTGVGAVLMLVGAAAAAVPVLRAIKAPPAPMLRGE